MKNNLIQKLVVAAAIVFAVAGCAPEPPKTSIPGAELYSAEKIAGMYISSIQLNQLDNIELYFSKAVDPKIVKQSAQALYDSTQIGQFKSKQISGDKENALVEIVYNYSGKNADSGPTKDKQYATLQMKMVKEDGSWKIRTTGIPETDQAIENQIFLQCLNTVLDATIAEERIRARTDVYSSRVTDLQRAVKFDDKNCSELTIGSADETSYQILAKTKNLKPCDITANTDIHTPETYQGCYE